MTPVKQLSLLLEADLQAAREENNRLRRTINQMKGPERRLSLLHPCAIEQFAALANEPALLKAGFKPFETYRSPMRQLQLYESVPQVTKAQPWQSAHQFGLAVDFVPFINGMWSWADHEPWDVLARHALKHGLRVPIAWDKAHVEHPAFARYHDVYTEGKAR